VQRFDAFEINELKLIYRVLHANLMAHLELMDAEFFSDLQSYLQRRAGADGVDVADHGAWDAWLGQEHTPCEVRVAGRRVLEP
jgi:hypothetical protein